MNDVSIDVIVPVFNAQKYIADAIQSIQAQTYRVSRIIICDDGSTDQTETIVKKFIQHDARISLLKLNHGGISSARNAGIRASSADFIAFLDADDIWLPNKLELQISVFQSSPSNVGFVHSSYFFMDETGEVLRNIPVTPPKTRGDIFLPLLFEQYVLSGSASSVVVRKEVLDQVGHFDEKLFYGEDWDLWLRLAKHSHVDFTPEAVVGIRIHDESAQHKMRPDRAIQFFQHCFTVYSKWPDLIQGHKGFVNKLRQHAIQLILPMIKQPSELMRFYKYLSAHENRFVKHLFKNPLDFCWKLGLAVGRIFYYRFRRIVGINEQ